MTDEWFCEATWAGDYECGDFDRTDIVTGSGGRVRGKEVVFVSPGSTVDRVHSIDTNDGAWVSNSLVCLLASSGARINQTSSRYFWIFRTSGLARYRRFFPTSAGPVRLTYFDNLLWDGAALTLRPKDATGRDFSTFARYSNFLDESIMGLGRPRGCCSR